MKPMAALFAENAFSAHESLDDFSAQRFSEPWRIGRARHGRIIDPLGAFVHERKIGRASGAQRAGVDAQYPRGVCRHELHELRQAYSTKSKLIEEIDSLDPDDRHYRRRKSDLDDRLYGMYDKIEELESLLIAARAKKQAIEAEKLTGDNIYKVLIYFDQLYGKMDDREKRQLIEELISEIQIYEERQPNGQWLKSIKFKLPIIAEDMSLSLDNDAHIETVVRLKQNK